MSSESLCDSLKTAFNFTWFLSKSAQLQFYILRYGFSVTTPKFRWLFVFLNVLALGAGMGYTFTNVSCDVHTTAISSAFLAAFTVLTFVIEVPLLYMFLNSIHQMISFRADENLKYRSRLKERQETGKLERKIQ